MVFKNEGLMKIIKIDQDSGLATFIKKSCLIEEESKLAVSLLAAVEGHFSDQMLSQVHYVMQDCPEDGLPLTKK